MMTGINVNIQHGGVTYHIQTEDGGLENPVITTLLFKEGAICSSKKTNYKELLQTNSFEETVKRLMEVQHKEMIQELTAGKFEQADTGHPAPSPSPSVQMDTQEQDEGKPPVETKKPVKRERKGLDALIQDYLANKQAGQD